jgi:hypothetical protein
MSLPVNQDDARIALLARVWHAAHRASVKARQAVPLDAQDDDPAIEAWGNAARAAERAHRVLVKALEEEAQGT